MQDFNVLRPEGYIDEDRQTLNDNFTSVITDFSSTVFPTNNLYAGMKCNRTDQKKIYLLQADLSTWTLILDYSNNKVTVPNAANAAAATNDAEGQEIAATYVKGVDQKAGASSTLEITKGDGTKTEVDLSITKADIGLNRVDNTADVDKHVAHAVDADNAVKAEQDKDGNVISNTYLKKKPAGMWQPNEQVSVGTIRFLEGEQYAGYYLKCTTAGITGSTQPVPVLGG